MLVSNVLCSESLLRKTYEDQTIINKFSHSQWRTQITKVKHLQRKAGLCWQTKGRILKPWNKPSTSPQRLLPQVEAKHQFWNCQTQKERINDEPICQNMHYDILNTFSLRTASTASLANCSLSRESIFELRVVIAIFIKSDLNLSAT